VSTSTSSTVPTLPSTTAAFRFSPSQLRALHRRALERGAELRLRHLQDLARERARVLAA
jgi:hypothetical protein